MLALGSRVKEGPFTIFKEALRCVNKVLLQQTIAHRQVGKGCL
jgi:hypothetical protein